MPASSGALARAVSIASATRAQNTQCQRGGLLRVRATRLDRWRRAAARRLGARAYMDNRGVASACATSFAVGVIVGFSLNRWLRGALKKLEGGL